MDRRVILPGADPERPVIVGWVDRPGGSGTYRLVRRGTIRARTPTAFRLRPVHWRGPLIPSAPIITLSCNASQTRPIRIDGLFVEARRLPSALMFLADRRDGDDLPDRRNRRPEPLQSLPDCAVMTPMPSAFIDGQASVMIY
jgi:hypothetical protein